MVSIINKKKKSKDEIIKELEDLIKDLNNEQEDQYALIRDLEAKLSDKNTELKKIRTIIFKQREIIDTYHSLFRDMRY